MRGRGPAREHLRGARPAAVRSCRHGWHRARQRARVASGSRALRIQGMQAAGASPLVLESAVSLHRGHDGRRAAHRLRCRRAGRADLRARRTRAPRRRSCACEPWQNVHRRAARRAPGRAAARRRARVWGSPEIAIAASAGMARVRVAQPTRGRRDLHRQRARRAGRAVLPHQIRRSNVLRDRRRPAAARLSARVPTITCVDDLEELDERASNSTSIRTMCSF